MGKKKDGYRKTLERLQGLLVETQAWVIAEGIRPLIVFEGRDSAGKDGAIKRITEFAAPRQTRVVALPKPTDRETSQWYFQRYVPHLPAAGETVIFNRSWYNRAGVEPVMGFCTPGQYESFLKDAPHFERMLTDDGIVLIKLWLDISKGEQAKRLEERIEDPLKRFKVSPLDKEAQARWDAYSQARDRIVRDPHPRGGLDRGGHGRQEDRAAEHHPPHPAHPGRTGGRGRTTGRRCGVPRRRGRWVSGPLIRSRVRHAGRRA